MKHLFIGGIADGEWIDIQPDVVMWAVSRRVVFPVDYFAPVDDDLQVYCSGGIEYSHYKRVNITGIDDPDEDVFVDLALDRAAAIALLMTSYRPLRRDVKEKLA